MELDSSSIVVILWRPSPSKSTLLGESSRLKLHTNSGHKFVHVKIYITYIPNSALGILLLQDYESPFEENWGHALPVYACLRKTLKVVDVKGYRGTNDERCLLTYFVCGARVMKKLNIEFRGDSGAYLQLERMLQILKSPSPNLQITIYTAN